MSTMIFSVDIVLIIFVLYNDSSIARKIKRENLLLQKKHGKFHLSMNRIKNKSLNLRQLLFNSQAII